LQTVFIRYIRIVRKGQTKAGGARAGDQKNIVGDSIPNQNRKPHPPPTRQKTGSWRRERLLKEKHGVGLLLPSEVRRRGLDTGAADISGREGIRVCANDKCVGRNAAEVVFVDSQVGILWN